MTDDFLFGQVGRLSCLPYFNTLHADGIDELARTLRDCCANEKQAIEVVNECVGWTAVPTPADLQRVAHRLFHEQEHSGCAHCSGSGYVVYVKRGYECAAPCPVCHPQERQRVAAGERE